MYYQNTILIVDDEPSVREVLAALLFNQGYHLAFACDGEDGLRQATALRPDVILLDVMMPGMDGFDVCRRIRANADLADTPVLIITALDDRDSRLTGIEAGADDFISKPFDRGELRARLRTITQLNRARRLMLERAKFEQVVEMSPNGIMVIDPDGSILLANPAMEQMLGTSAASLPGTSLRALLSPDHAEAVLARLHDVLDGSQQRIQLEALLLRAQPDPLAVEIDAGYVAWDLRPAAQIIVRDITERKRAEADAQRQLERLAVLRSIDATIISSLDLHVMLGVILDQALGQLRLSAGAVLLRKQYTNTFEYAVMRGIRKEPFARTSVQLGEGGAGLAALHRRTVRSPKLAETDLDVPAAMLDPAFPVYLGMPLIVKGQVEGILELYHSTLLSPDAEWLHFLETLAGQAAVAIDHSALLLSLQHTNAELMRAYDTTLEGWARALELRDKETEGHSKRVTEMTVLLARHMGISEADLVHIRRGALLHDIGKMGIPDSILFKPGPLSEDEWKIMRQHPVFAYDLLTPVTYLGPALDIPYCHHEKWDGTGYPRGLKGEQIPLAARIFAVIDVWDALLFDRPYRKGWPEERVYQHIRDLSGTHFDPQVVDAFMSIDRNKVKPRISVLIVDNEEDAVSSLSQALSDEFTIFTACSGAAALDILMKQEIAVMLIDQRMTDFTGVQVLERARHIRPQTLGILCSGEIDSQALSAALNLGTVRGFIQKPWKIADLRRRLHEVVLQYQMTARDAAKLFVNQI